MEVLLAVGVDPEEDFVHGLAARGTAAAPLGIQKIRRGEGVWWATVALLAAADGAPARPESYNFQGKEAEPGALSYSPIP